MKLIYADFMKFDEKGLVLTTRGTWDDLAKYNIRLEEGLKLVFYNEDEDYGGNRDDLVVEGIVEYDTEKERWIAKVEHDEVKNISRLTVEEREKLGFS